MKTFMLLMILSVTAPALAEGVCQVSQNGKVIQTILEDSSGPLANEKSAVVSFSQSNGVYNLCVFAAISPVADVACTQGKTELNLQYNEESIQCRIQ